MTHNYACVHDSIYLQLHDLQPPQPLQPVRLPPPAPPPVRLHPHFQHPYHTTALASNASAASSYELVARGAEEEGAGSRSAVVEGGAHALTPTHHRHAHAHDINEHRKRKSHHFGSSSAYDEDDGEDRTSSCRSLPDKKQNHSEIEKRRRDKMNTYITELSTMIPMCGAMARKLDKLTVLRMAVQHIRSIRGALTACPLTARPKTTLLSDREVDSLILQAAHDCFLLVVGCDRGRLLYVSASAQKMLHYDPTELLGQSLFDLLHPKDVAKVKEQLSSSDFSPRERLIDAKTMLPVKADLVTTATRFCPGARRSFFCRIKCRLPPDDQLGTIKEETFTCAKVRKKQQPDRKYAVVHCTGYLKTWAPNEMSEGAAEGVVTDECDASSTSCLVAVGRALPDLFATAPITQRHRPLQFFSRHATDGKFLFVDQRVTLALGFLPQELVGTSLYEYVTGPELGSVARAHKTALLRRAPLQTPAYCFRRKDGTVARITTHFKPFRNPWTKEVDCLVANNTLLVEGQTMSEEGPSQLNYDLLKHEGLFADEEAGVSGTHPHILLSEPDLEMQRLIDSQVESHKIGSAIAEEVFRRSSPAFSPELPPDLLHDAMFASQSSAVDTILSDGPSYSQVRNNVPLSSTSANSPPPLLPTEASPPAATSSPPLPLGMDGNGEATMAVIMSLLEADAGLGGPVNFSGLPWPLP